MQRISRENLIYAMSREHQPVLTVKPGETVQIETEDCFRHKITREEERLSPQFDFQHVNPATGPIGIRGAKPGHTLHVLIDDIEVDSRGVTTVYPGFGLLGDLVKTPETRISAISKGKVLFLNRFQVPVREMIGVIGVAPAGSPIPCTTPGPHGGNLDTADVGIGSEIYLPVFVPEALLAIGDVHAAMADGEICGTGVETRAVVTATVNLIDDLTIPAPLIHAKDLWVVIASDKSLPEATQKVSKAAISFLQRKLDLTFEDAYMLLSLAGNLHISQVVNPLVTVRVSISDGILSS